MTKKTSNTFPPCPAFGMSNLPPWSSQNGMAVSLASRSEDTSWLNCGDNIYHAIFYSLKDSFPSCLVDIFRDPYHSDDVLLADEEGLLQYIALAALLTLTLAMDDLKT